MKRSTEASLNTLTQCFLALLATGALVTFAALLSQGRSSPKLLKVFTKYGVWRIRQMLRRLKFQGLIIYDEEDEHSPILLTEKGFVRKTKEKLKNMRAKKWDHFWRLVQFDIPDRKGVRRRFQKLLRRLGFFRVQNSVYAYPHECKQDVLRLAAQFHISRDVMISTVPYLGQYEKTARAFYFQQHKR